MTLVAVAGTGPLIHLAELDALSLLSLTDLYVPETVYGELANGGVPVGLDDLEWTGVSADVWGANVADLDPGETAAIAVAAEHDAVFLTDDLAAREHANERGIGVHGTIGVVALGCAQGRFDRDEAASLMRRLQRETSRFVTIAVVERGVDRLDGN